MHWTGSVGTSGYGRIARGERGAGIVDVHRLAWELANGPIPAGKFVLHHCDVKVCVNPAHLFIGTQKDNIIDMMAKGRGRGGAKPGNRNGACPKPSLRRGGASTTAKITPAQAGEIRAAIGALDGVARRLGISVRHAYRVRSRLR